MGATNPIFEISWYIGKGGRYIISGDHRVTLVIESTEFGSDSEPKSVALQAEIEVAKSERGSQLSALRKFCGSENHGGKEAIHMRLRAAGCSTTPMSGWHVSYSGRHAKTYATSTTVECFSALQAERDRLFFLKSSIDDGMSSVKIGTESAATATESRPATLLRRRAIRVWTAD